MSPRFNRNRIASSDGNKVDKVTVIEAVSVHIVKRKYVKVFGKLIPITDAEALTLNSLNIIEL